MAPAQKQLHVLAKALRMYAIADLALAHAGHGSRVLHLQHRLRQPTCTYCVCLSRLPRLRVQALARPDDSGQPCCWPL